MKNIYASIFLILLLLTLTTCQSKSEQKPASSPPASILVIVPTIQEKVYDRPTVQSLPVAMIQPEEILQVLDTTDYFFYKVKLNRAEPEKEGYILKAAFTDKPHLVPATALSAN